MIINKVCQNLIFKRNMDLVIPLSQVLAFTVLLFMVVKIGWSLRTKSTTLKLPPGPKKLPLIGNLHQLMGGLPHHSLRKLADKYGPLMRLKLGEVSTVVVSSPEMAEQVMKTHDHIFASRPAVLATKILFYDSSGMSFSPYGPYWRHIRKICTTELLSFKRVESFRSIREEEVSNFIKMISLNEGSPMDLTEKIISLSFGITSRIAFGKKSKEQEEYISTMDEGLKFVGRVCLADQYPSIQILQLITGMRYKLEKLHLKLDKILDKIIESHRESMSERKSLQEDLVDVLLKVQKQNDLGHPLSDGNVKAVIIDIFSGGSGTVASTIGWAMSEMIKNPKVMKEAQAEVRRVFKGKDYVDDASSHELIYLKAVIRETLRLHPPAPLLLPRVCTEKCEINGYDIPAKTKVIVNAYAINRDPRYWTEPEKFLPERFLDSTIDYRGGNFAYIPFGAGRRICPGILYGMANLESIMAKLLYHFNWELSNGMKHEELDMVESLGLSLKRKHNLVLVPRSYCSSP